MSEILAPLLRLAARTVSRGAATTPLEWRRALIVGHGHIGDVLYQTVSLESLRDCLPDCELDYLTTPIAAEALTGNPALTRILEADAVSSTGRVSSQTLIALGAAHYDAIICTNLVRHQEGLLLGLRLGIPNRVAFTHRGLTGLATIPVRLQHPMTPARQSRVMMKAITGVPDDSELRPHVFPTLEDEAEATKEFERLGFARDDTILACSITTRQSVGQVQSDFFARILTAVRETDPSIRIVLCGSADDELVLRSAASRIPGEVALSYGRMSIRGYAAFLRKCSVFFGMDSGPRHLANAAGIPVVFVRNMAVRAAEAGVYCDTETDIAPDGEFLEDAEAASRLATVDASKTADVIVNAARRKR